MTTTRTLPKALRWAGWLTFTTGLLAVVAFGPIRPAGEKPTNVPTWTLQDAQAHPECVAVVQWDVNAERLGEDAGLERLPDAFVVAHLNGDRSKMPAEDVFERTSNDRIEDDVWVVGLCRPLTR